MHPFLGTLWLSKKQLLQEEASLNNVSSCRWQQCVAGWIVHAFTASGAFIGLLALLAIYYHNLLSAFWLMGAAIVVDAIDGFFARALQVKTRVPRINGELLDNIVDFVNYTIVPSFFLLVTPLLPEYSKIPCVLAIVFASAYQFTQIDAKTSDHFFKGFPSYWNIAVFYLFFWQMQPAINLAILLTLAVLCFVPIKYIYPSRMDYLSHNQGLRIGMMLATLVWGFATAGLMWVYPNTNHILVIISMGYMILYAAASLYRTWKPLTQANDRKLDTDDYLRKNA